MRLRVMAPAKILLETDTEKIVAAGRSGSFCLLPHHADFVSQLAAGELLYEREGGGMTAFIIEESLLLKNGELVLVSSSGATEPARKVATALEMTFSQRLTPGED